MILQDVYCSGNIKVDKLIQEMHLKINSKNDTIFEWIPYNQFDNIKEIMFRQINNLITNWNKNKKIDNLIQEMRLKINSKNDVVFECIPYNQFDDIEEISKNDYATINSATWKDGPLNYDYYCMEYIRKSDKKVSLKCLHNSQNNTNEFLNEV